MTLASGSTRGGDREPVASAGGPGGVPMAGGERPLLEGTGPLARGDIVLGEEGPRPWLGRGGIQGWPGAGAAA